MVNYTKPTHGGYKYSDEFGVYLPCEEGVEPKYAQLVKRVGQALKVVETSYTGCLDDLKANEGSANCLLVGFIECEFRPYAHKVGQNPLAIDAVLVFSYSTNRLCVVAFNEISEITTEIPTSATSNKVFLFESQE